MTRRDHQHARLTFVFAETSALELRMRLLIALAADGVVTPALFGHRWREIGRDAWSLAKETGAVCD